MHYTLIVARMAAEDSDRVSTIWSESDATELPHLIGVRHRSLFRFHDLYFQLIGSEGGLGERIEAMRGHPLFREVNERLRPHIAAYDPATWRGPADAMAKEFYSWDA
ncbi:TcmI family type II polyketide cyclase [Actinacidiphila acididurans]|uniref:TcmI family type II polyketide cyclase n=1 Tax=Actinacidiphila acididurans TaxID=2784346 RepID=A0ABS2TXX1_9ACTN|nr:TcmI family type II polyketide cyclase [Actinacidiphila acididurans]MBM9508198.1 TcmI family type II polyketide cyclase [Actinacidiphila acididurans]